MKSNILFILFMLLAAASINATAQNTSSKGLKDYYRRYFPIGVAVGPHSLHGADSALIVREFNSLTPENAMKMASIHPKEDVYNWKDADAIVDFAVAHKMKVRGHNLCWHQQVPKWMFKDSLGNQVTREVLLKRLRDHIFAVVGRYKGKIYAWDVVNEAIDDSPSRFLRSSPWEQICGEEFIAKAFEYAHEADPKAVLFYNDYNTEKPEKRERVYKLLKKLLDAGVPVGGIGLQGHWSINEPTEQNLRETIHRFSALGLQVQITELDVSVYAGENYSRKLKENEVATYTPEMEQKQTALYDMVFRVFRECKKEISGVTFWNVTDKNSWLDNFPVPNRKNFPLLFDQNRQPKKAYQAVTQF